MEPGSTQHRPKIDLRWGLLWMRPKEYAPEGGIRDHDSCVAAADLVAPACVRRCLCCNPAWLQSTRFPPPPTLSAQIPQHLPGAMDGFLTAHRRPEVRNGLVATDFEKILCQRHHALQARSYDPGHPVETRPQAMLFALRPASRGYTVAWVLMAVGPADVG